jgi:hypothetical protein
LSPIAVNDRVAGQLALDLDSELRVMTPLDGREHAPLIARQRRHRRALVVRVGVPVAAAIADDVDLVVVVLEVVDDAVGAALLERNRARRRHPRARRDAPAADDHAEARQQTKADEGLHRRR